MITIMANVANFTKFCDKEFVELGGDECDNLNFMNFKTDSTKIREIANFRNF